MSPQTCIVTQLTDREYFITMASIGLEDLRSGNFVQYLECFEKKVEENVLNFFCKVDGCKKSYKDKSGAIRHLQSKHKEYCELIQENNKDEVKQKDTCIEVRCKIDANAIWNACVGLVCTNGLPICFVDYPAFKEITKPYAAALQTHGQTTAMNRENLKIRIKTKGLAIKNEIKSQVEGKTISLLADIASRYNRSVLGISISYSYNDRIYMRTIAMKVLQYSHTAAYIFQMIKEILSDYGIGMEQVVSGTTDNGRNMIKAIADLDAHYQDMVSNNDAGERDITSENDDIIDHSIFDDEYYEHLLREVSSMFDDNVHTDIIHGISCAAHCIHLVISHAIDDTPEIKILLDKSRCLAKKLRTPTLRTMMKEAGVNMAIIDVVTRWNSIHDMVCSK